jgi:hypothetical protein
MNSWYNFKTQDYDTREIDTDEIALEAISQLPAAQSMYRCYRQLGLSVAHSMLNVLTASVGQEPPFSPPAPSTAGTEDAQS